MTEKAWQRIGSAASSFAKSASLAPTVLDGNLMAAFMGICLFHKLREVVVVEKDGPEMV